MFIRPFEAQYHYSKLLEWFSDLETMRAMGMDVMDANSLSKWLADDSRIILMAHDDGHPIGMVNLYHYKTQHPDFELGYLIDPLYRGVGLGELMVQLSLGYIRQFHPEIKRLTQTYVEGFNSPSRRILDKLGFTLDYHDAERDRYYYTILLD